MPRAFPSKFGSGVGANRALCDHLIGVYGLAVMRGEASEPISIFAWKMVKVFAILSLHYLASTTAATSSRVRRDWDSMATLFVAPAAGPAATALLRLTRLTWLRMAAGIVVGRCRHHPTGSCLLASLLFSFGTVISWCSVPSLDFSLS